MNITIETEQDIFEIKRYLNEEYKISNKTRKSSYFVALTHARILTGRDIKNGSIIKEENIGDWAGACIFRIGLLI